MLSKVVNWDDLLYMTRPEEWSSVAVSVATCILESNPSGKQLLSFYSNILLSVCLKDISDSVKDQLSSMTCASSDGQNETARKIFLVKLWLLIRVW